MTTPLIGRAWRTSAQSFALILLVLGAGCATAPDKTAQGPVFYPSLPNPPRIQHLTSFSTSEDVEQKSSFREFVVGTDEKKIDALSKPYGVAMYDGKLLAIDTRGGGYVVFDLVGKDFRRVRGTGSAHMVKPINITIDEDGTRYITDTQRKQVLVFDRLDNYVRAYGVAGQFQPGDVALLEDKLYVTDLAGHKVHVLDKRSGETLFTFGGVGSNDGEFFYPTNIKISPQGIVYVSDTGNFRVQSFTLDGVFVGSHGRIGTGLGQFARPKGIDIDHEGRIYVVDAAFQNVQILNPEGQVLLYFGGPGSDPESINLPTDVAVDYDNVKFFQKYAAPGFELEYVVLVASQYGANKVNVFGFGHMQGMDYSMSEQPLQR